MSALPAILAFCRRYWLQIVAVLALAAAVAWVWHAIHDYGARQFEAGRQQVLAADALAVAAARTQADQHAAAAAAAGTAMHAQLDIALPHIEVATHDATERIRTIYLAAPAGPAAVCERPAGVQDELDAARRRANAAASGGL